MEAPLSEEHSPTVSQMVLLASMAHCHGIVRSPLCRCYLMFMCGTTTFERGECELEILAIESLPSE